ncbi:MAG: hypothetical protein RBU45_08975 [Myxococcota bacterium]|jgi:hypothetical protein|nr:hypothetical protein [Myxococcota bacterium]
MLQTVIQGGLELGEARNSLALSTTVLGSLAYLPSQVSLAGLADALALSSWPAGLPEDQVGWEITPALDAPSLAGGRVLVRPTLLLTTPSRLLAVEGAWLEDPILLSSRLELVAHAVAATARAGGWTGPVALALISAHPTSPLAKPAAGALDPAWRWCSWEDLLRTVRSQASRQGLPPNLGRLVDDLDELLLRRGLAGHAGLTGLLPATPPLASPRILDGWLLEEPFGGFGALPPGPGSVLLREDFGPRVPTRTVPR